MYYYLVYYYNLCNLLGAIVLNAYKFKQLQTKSNERVGGNLSQFEGLHQFVTIGYALRPQRLLNLGEVLREL